jgi:oxygen-independent coproporphyrinogen-3 oxidase
MKMKSTTSDMFQLIQKYNVPGPRYTSYPTAVQFSETFDSREIEERIARSRSSGKPLSLYVHIPFCFSLCWYCGCTKIITRDRSRGDVYLDYLEKEAVLIRQSLEKAPDVKQIHFGGGTPTFLSPEQLRRLGDLIHKNFNVHPDVEFSVEIDPRRCTAAHVVALSEIGINRASLGVQDTNENVQEAIHRIQPFEQTEKVTDRLRTYGISDINFDLIYGLPRQSVDTFRQTIVDVTALEPNRLAIYSYAHMPGIMLAQKLLNEAEFPSSENKLKMLMTAIALLPDYGFRYIGMDHFAREDDELSRALDEGTLHRNFQGYSTHAELDMVALGMSGISMGEMLYVQNKKDIGGYYEALDDGRLPIQKVLELSDEDRLRRSAIMGIMCRGEINYDEYNANTGIDFKSKFSREIGNLDDLETDGLLVKETGGFYVRETGRLFLRNVAMVFDGYREKKEGRVVYSKTV